ncbi:translation initiation factor IF-2, chloroplastic isoform X2 [Amaranthus tricolor]|uniref:translation initiation factor IF-2, chloroplastic isoform X2 n=1 Tax=Amaranthus tricolor TaxID=29722 RepID=UPI00258D740C|nr:translation initiation factor IF-2, chloroplastic isoform X2 [Amaranthus tricolor]
MATMASLVSLGSSGATCSGQLEVSFSLVKKITLPRRNSSCNFRQLGGERRWRYVSVCRLSVITDYVSEQGNAVSLENPYSESKEEGLILKPSPKPVLKSGSDGNRKFGESSVAFSSNGKLDNVEERKKVIESLDEVLEKAERLETANLQADNRKDSTNVNKPSPSISSSTNGKPVNNLNKGKPKAAKSVWRKGNPVSTVQKVVQESPKIEKVERVEARTDSQSTETIRPPLPLQRPEIKLQAKPSTAPPPMPKKPVLKDVGMSSRADGKDQSVKSKERKPILVDKFATKKASVDPSIAQAVIAPPKPAKLPSGKFKDDYRKKGLAAGGPKRRMVDDDDIEMHEDTSELGLSIPGAATARKGRKWSKASRKAARRQAARDAAPVKVEILEVEEKGMSTEELAYNLAISEGEILGYLYSKGIKPDGVQTLDKAMVKMICERYDVEVLDALNEQMEEMARKKEIFDDDDLGKLEDRPPVLTIMGHVDHGKTTLLDYIRKSKVAASEAGGITQGIGAYKVEVPVDGKLLPCVFLDTPGHEAFGAMRARGARVTDIAIIVVAADDGIRPQTNEAIAHAKAAGVPIVVAINKIDKDGANPDRVMQELSSIGLMPEDWGGDTPMVKISALKGENVDELLETVMLVAELQELKANPQRNAKGTVIEAGLHKSKGPIATFIVQNGTLKQGDTVVCGEAFGKVRALFDHGGSRVDEAGPSIPVQVIGLNNVPFAGDEFEVVSSLDIAREKAEVRAESLRNERIAAKAGDGKVTLSSLASAVSSGKMAGLDLHQLNIILKVDVQGSIEALRQALEVLPQDNVTLKFLLQATGDVTTSDVDLAVASKAIILGFNVKAPGSVEKLADNKGVEIRLYKVIYDLIDDMRSAMEGMLDPVEEQVAIGTAEVRATFSSGSGRVAGCMVTEGKITKGCGIRVIRKGKTVHVGVLDSLRRVKETVEEVNNGLECGIGLEDYDDFEVGDTLEAFNSVQKKRTLEEASAQVTAALEGAGVSR